MVAQLSYRKSPVKNRMSKELDPSALCIRTLIPCNIAVFDYADNVCDGLKSDVSCWTDFMGWLDWIEDERDFRRVEADDWGNSKFFKQLYTVFE